MSVRDRIHPTPQPLAAFNALGKDLAVGGVTTAGSGLKPGAIEHPQLATVVFDQALALQAARGGGDADPPHPQQLRQQLGGDAKMVDLRPVVAHQQPARQPRANLVEAQAGSRHRQLRHVVGQANVHDTPKRLAARELIDKGFGPDAPSRARALHHRTQRRQQHAQRQLGAKHAELLARAVRDHLADCLVTLPTLLQRRAEGSLHFYIANLSGLRRALFPALLAAYEEWQRHPDSKKLSDVIAQGETHWLRVAHELMQIFDAETTNGDARLNHLAGHLDPISL